MPRCEQLQNPRSSALEIFVGHRSFVEAEGPEAIRFDARGAGVGEDVHPGGSIGALGGEAVGWDG
eukprot:CAMPEP_0171323834 /NCGR_PEP_ID=MMETSP0816-20121228/115825_1 /TAXON_ID=420281 /ORGANISM="Proboscia inermis, Strain CCAP1064/1" /LENGTH=64 /DNA_ID=CAMNT_0011822645 /DNA_START=1197 /DNA_END=1391 /DNA_ORIENTATION=+